MPFFGTDDDLLGRIALLLVREQQDDGSWLPDDSTPAKPYRFETTLLVLEALRQEICARRRTDPRIPRAVQRGQGFLLSRHVFLDAGRPVKPAWTTFSFPPYWFYDALAALEYLAAAGAPRDPRAQPAIDLVLRRRRPDGRWLLGSPHREDPPRDGTHGGAEPMEHACAPCGCSRGGRAPSADEGELHPARPKQVEDPDDARRQRRDGEPDIARRGGRLAARQEAAPTTSTMVATACATSSATKPRGNDRRRWKKSTARSMEATANATFAASSNSSTGAQR